MRGDPLFELRGLILAARAGSGLATGRVSGH